MADTLAAMPFLYPFLRNRSMSMEQAAPLIIIGAGATWTALGALIGLQFDINKSRAQSLIFSGVLVAFAVALLLPVLPWGISLVQFVPLMIEQQRNIQTIDIADQGGSQMDAEIGRLVRKMERGDSPRQLLTLIQRREVPQDIADRHAASVVKFLRERGEGLRGSEGDIVQFLSRFCKTPEAKTYMLEVLAGPATPLRNRMIRFLFWTNTWIGDADIYAALETVFKREGAGDGTILAAMQKVGSEQSKETLRQALLSAPNKDAFQGLVSIVSRTNDDSLFQTVIQLIPKHGEMPAWATKELWEGYLDRAEGKKLEEALGVACGYGKRFTDELLFRKMKSADPVSRAAAYRTVQCFMKVYYQSGGPAVVAVKTAAKSEPDAQARKAASDAWGFWCKEHPLCENKSMGLARD